jgi:Calcineurin-like phosphoesterase
MAWLSRAPLFRSHRADNFQIMSDLHLEIGQQYRSFTIPPCAPYLVLAGDIGRLRDYEGLLSFIASHCQLFRHIFLVLGNHEFFGSSRAEGVAAVKKLEHEPLLQDKFTVLYRTRVDISDTITVMGCTLQSFIPPESCAVVESKVSDFKEIKDWSVDDHNAEHLQDLECLEHELRAIQKDDAAGPRPPRRILVVTHHAPSVRGCSAPQHETNAWSSAFATELLDNGYHDLSTLLTSSTWVFGHTQYSAYLEKGGFRLISNQRGYIFPHADTRLISGETKTASAWRQSKGWFGSNKGNQFHCFDVRKTIKI